MTLASLRYELVNTFIDLCNLKTIHWGVISANHMRMAFHQEPRTDPFLLQINLTNICSDAVLVTEQNRGSVNTARTGKEKKIHQYVLLATGRVMKVTSTSDLERLGG